MFVGPAGERTALRWAGLPPTWIVSRLNLILERGAPVVDTLSLAQWYDDDPAVPAFPSALHDHGSEHGEVMWFGFPMHFFEVEQAREVARVAMRVLGIQPAPSARVAIRRR